MFIRNIIFLVGLILLGKCVQVDGQSENDGCGLTELEMNYLTIYLKFPRGGKEFNNKSNCLIKIKPHEGYIANVSILNMSIYDPNSNCDQGNIQVAEKLEAFTKATKYCGTETKEDIFRSLEPFYIKINMTGMVIPATFKFLLEQYLIGEPNDGCGNNSVQLTSIKQFVKFPLDDEIFTNVTDCIVQVNPIAGYKASTSVESIDIDYPFNYIFDGYFQVAETMDALDNATKYRGTKPAGHILDDSETVYIHIKMVGVKPTTTFTLGFISSRIGQPNDGCGENSVQLNSIMQSVNFPLTDQPFTDKTNCIVKVNPMTGYKTSTFIESIEINDPNSNCDQGYFQVAQTTDALVNATRHCGMKQVGQILEASEIVYAQINMAGMKQTATFTLKFVSIRIGQPNDGCGNNIVQLNSKTQSVKFPLDDQPFSDKTNCIVKVGLLAGYKTYTSIESIEINDPNLNCDQGYFQVAPTVDAFGNATRYCGTKQAEQILEALETVYVQINMTGMKQTVTFTLKFLASSTSRLTSSLLAMIFLLGHQLASS